LVSLRVSPITGTAMVWLAGPRLCLVFHYWSHNHCRPGPLPFAVAKLQLTICPLTDSLSR